MIGIANFRDLGGIATRDGRRVRQRRLLRGGSLTKAEPTDLIELRERYDLVNVIDLRTAEEAEAHPDLIPEGVSYRFVPVREKLESFIPGDMQSMPLSTQAKMAIATQRGLLDVDAILKKSYVGFLLSEIGRQGYSTMFDILLDTPNGSTFFHCSAGKDRTGLAAVLILHALNVGPEEIQKDYLATNDDPSVVQRVKRARKAIAEAGITDRKAIDQVIMSMEVNTGWLKVALEAVSQQYGDLDNYLEKALGLTPEKRRKLQDMYLEPCA